MAYQKKKKYQNQQTVPGVIILGIFRLIGGLFRLIFKGFAVKRGLNTEDRQSIILQRHQIEKMLQSENIHELKQAVFEADKMVDKILKLNGYAGETFADRLRSARDYIDHSLYDQIWQGHKIRNQLAHEQESGIKNQELRNAGEKLLRYTKSI